jgi:hypothetical protein
MQINIGYQSDNRFVNSINAVAKKMAISGNTWTESGGEQIATWSENVPMPAGGAGTSINGYITGGLISRSREVASSNGLNERVVRALFTRGTVLSSVDDILSFIRSNKEWTSTQKARYENQFNSAKSAGRINL